MAKTDVKANRDLFMNLSRNWVRLDLRVARSFNTDNPSVGGRVASVTGHPYRYGL